MAHSALPKRVRRVVAVPLDPYYKGSTIRDACISPPTQSGSDLRLDSYQVLHPSFSVEIEPLPLLLAALRRIRI